MTQVTHPKEATPVVATSDEKWERHKFLESLYEFYLEKILNFHSFYLPIAGAVVAYVLTFAGSPTAAFGLLIPLVVSLGAAWIFYLSIRDVTELNEAIHESAKNLDIISTHVQLLVRSVVAFFALHVIIVVGLIAALVFIVGFGHIPGLNPPAKCPTGTG